MFHIHINSIEYLHKWLLDHYCNFSLFRPLCFGFICDSQIRSIELVLEFHCAIHFDQKPQMMDLTQPLKPKHPSTITLWKHN